MRDTIRQGLHYVRCHPPATVWREFIRPDNAHPLVQFSKYAFFGVLSTVVHSVVFGVCGWSGLLPHFASQGYPTEKRLIYFAGASLAGFLASGVFAYFTNVTWVFDTGRHHAITEFLLFMAVAAIGFCVGVGFGVREILIGSGSSWVASVVLVVSAVLVNFATRKFLIFRG